MTHDYDRINCVLNMGIGYELASLRVHVLVSRPVSSLMLVDRVPVVRITPLFYLLYSCMSLMN